MRTLFRKLPRALGELVEKHPFVDGNKRIAVAVKAAFPRVNGYLLEFDELEALSFLIGRYDAIRRTGDGRETVAFFYAQIILILHPGYTGLAEELHGERRPGWRTFCLRLDPDINKGSSVIIAASR
jgi:hypothetical protein